MDDTAQPPQPPVSDQPATHGILDKTMAEILKESPQAQSLIKKSMNISEEQFQKMLASTQQNDLMHMKVRDLFSKGIVQQAVSQQGQVTTSQQIQVTPEQMQQLQDGTMSVEDLQKIQPQQATEIKKKSFIGTLTEWFK